jgi:tetratricopeptide (TPR) repeat protein
VIDGSFFTGAVITMQPSMFKQTLDTALRLHQSGKLVEAEVCYRRALAMDPNHADALHLFGVWNFQSGRAQAAEPLIRRAIELAPRIAAFHNSLSAVLLMQKQWTAAETAAKTALAMMPNMVQAQRNLGHALSYLKRNQEAAEVYRQAIALEPGNAEAHFGLGNVLRNIGQWDQAIESYHQALRLHPTSIQAMNNLGGTLRLKGELAESLAVHRRAIAIQPGNAKANSNLGVTLLELGEFDAALTALRRGVTLQPTDPAMHFNLALALLMIGDFRNGWAEYEWRWGCEDFPSPVRSFGVPLWNGESLEGKRIVLYAEQGYGDTIQFARYVPLVAAMGGRVVLEVHEKLFRLLQHTPGAEVVIPRGQPVPEVDLNCPLMSLPRALGTILETIPPAPAVMFVDPQRAMHWREKLRQLPGSRRVGLVWAGRSWHLNDHNRSIAPVKLLPLLAIGDASFISLQKGRADWLPPLELGVVDWTDDLHDFADTAALVSELDCVIAVDTAVAHLSASLGKPTFLLLPLHADFRWLLNRADSPWYPSMRLMRQSIRGDWTDPLARVVEQLSG